MRSSAAASGSFRIGGDLPVHRLGLGAMRITGPGAWGPPRNRTDALAVLRRAVELGVTLIDTAEAYGPHVSEELIAAALHPYPADLVIATKGGYDRPDLATWTMNARPERLLEGLHGSLRRLRLERIDLYQLHRIDPAVPEEAQFGALQRGRESGLIRHIGLSEVTVSDIERARRFFPVASVQNRYNVVDRESDPVVDYCERERIAFVPWYPVLTGNAADIPAAARVARARGATPTQIALAWLLKRSDVMLPIPGTSQVAHLEENVAAAGIELSGRELADLSAPARR